MFEEQLINEICKYPCIFDKKDLNFKNKLKREKAWSYVAAATKGSVSQCQGRWKTLRDRFVKEVKRDDCPSGSGAPDGCVTWKFMAAMEFMRVHITPRATVSSVQWNGEQEEGICYEESPLFDESFQEIPSAQTFPDPPNTSKSRKRKAGEAAQESLDTLCETINTIVQEKFATVSRNEAFYKYLDTILTKVPENVQDAIKLNLIASCTELVNQELDNNTVLYTI